MMLIMERTANVEINQNGKSASCCGKGSATFIEKMLTIRVGNMMQMDRMVSVFIRIFKLLLTMETHASIRLEITCR